MATRRKLTPEYKAEGLALVVDSKRSVPEVAESLGCTCRWTICS